MLTIAVEQSSENHKKHKQSMQSYEHHSIPSACSSVGVLNSFLEGILRLSSLRGFLLSVKCVSSKIIAHLIFIFCRRTFAKYYDKYFLFLIGEVDEMLEADASLADANTCPFLASDLFSLSPELRKLVTLFNFLVLNLTPDEGVSSLLGMI